MYKYGQFRGNMITIIKVAKTQAIIFLDSGSTIQAAGIVDGDWRHIAFVRHQRSNNNVLTRQPRRERTTATLRLPRVEQVVFVNLSDWQMRSLTVAGLKILFSTKPP